MKRKNIGFTFKIIFLIIFAGIIMFPMLLLFLYSIKAQKESINSFIDLFSFSNIKFGNYIEAFKIGKVPVALLNSMIITLFSLLGQIFFGSLAAYALTKMKFKKSNIFLNLYLFPIIFSIQMFVLPVFFIFNILHLIDTYIGAIIIYIATGLPITVFILAKFLKSVPDSICEAASIEGASHFQIYYKIIIPLIKAPISVIIIINGLYVWNDFFVPLMFLYSDKATIPLGIYNFFDQYWFNWNLVSAYVIMVILPLIIAYLALQRFVIKGVAEGALKG